jgi:hypothetical protein
MWGAATLTAHLVSWRAAVFTLAAFELSGAERLPVERQLRLQAFRAMVTAAPGDGVLTMEHDGLEGCYMRAGLGSQLARHSPGGS